MTATIGFLSVRQHLGHGYFGGYLVVNHLARPLEFHCTLPLKPSRAQAVLYGSTLDDFVCGEQIGKALVDKAKVSPALILCDSSALLALGHVSNVPLAMLDFPSVVPEGCEQLQIPSSAQAKLTSIQVHDRNFLIPATSQLDEARLRELLSELSEHFELTEPFERVVEALVEAHPMAKAA